MFDYLFYLIYSFYAAKEKGAQGSASLIVGGLQASNLLSLYFLISYHFPNDLPVNKLFVLVVAIPFMIIAYIRYVYIKKDLLNVMDRKWQKLSNDQKTRIRALSLAYITISVCAFF